jgi:penicillin amidase
MIPNIYAENDEDLGRVLGYILARDRFFNMDLLRRLPQGRISELFGDVALSIDQESLDLGMDYVTTRLVERLSPRVKSYLEAIVSGVNDYIEAVRAGEEEAPSEFKLAGPLFATEPIALMTPWTLKDIVSMATTILYQTNFEDGEIRSTVRLNGLAQIYGDDANRRDAFIADVALNMTPAVLGNSSQADPAWGDGNPWSMTDDLEVAGEDMPQDESSGDEMSGEGENAPPAPVDMGLAPEDMELAPEDMGMSEEGKRDVDSKSEDQISIRQRPTSQLDSQTLNQRSFVPLPPEILRISKQRLRQLQERLRHREKWFGHDSQIGFGSNAWAASSSATHAGSIVSGDGHLQLSSPSLMYQIGLNTRALGGGDIAQKGLLLASIPVMAVGTNGKIAWSQVNPVVDITDWYVEQLILNENGAPQASLFQDEPRDLIATSQRVSVAGRALLGSEERVVEWTSYRTFDGRWIIEVEGRKLSVDEEPAEGEFVMTVLGERVVPGDTDGDGVVTATSFDYTAFDASNFIDALFSLGLANNLDEFEQETKRLVGGGLFSAAGDATGSILYTSYQAIPCRGYLERDESGFFVSGQSPMALLDGNRTGGFTIRTDAEGYVDESATDDPYQCSIPYDKMPASRDPVVGFVATANNDPQGFSDDGRVDNDAWYIGGPWSAFRQSTILRELGAAVDRGPITIETMRHIQANVDSRLGELFTPHLINTLDQLETWVMEGIEPGDPSHMIALNLYNAQRDMMIEVRDRLASWGGRGYKAHSGVETFYNTVDGDERLNATSTMIFNAYFRSFLIKVWDDEAGGSIPYDASRLRIYALDRMLRGRGPDNPLGLVSWSPQFEESIFFDHLDTPDHHERSEELMISALAEALNTLMAAPDETGNGGFGTEDMNLWLWGLRHLGKFESLLGPFLGDAGPLGLILDRFSVSTDKLPLADDLADDDPRRGLKWFPRPGDQWNIDAGNPGFSGDYMFGNGSVMRMTIQLDGDRVSGYNIVPGGQSGLEDSPHLLDQLKLWLANDAYPLRYHLEEVVEGAQARWRFAP